jgi:hypothetical protein
MGEPETEKYLYCTAPYDDNDNCDYLKWANFYFYAFLIYNLIDTNFQNAEAVDYFHFVFKTLGWPVVWYKFFNQICYYFTLKPWINPEVEPAIDEPFTMKIEQIVLLITFFKIMQKTKVWEKKFIKDNCKEKPNWKIIWQVIFRLLNFIVSLVVSVSIV